jgi:4-hydroxythreonine-4-phosphate dehydrogenase|uniref:Predicted 4-hydroxythreonine-4-phosphate dehydrogenase (4-(Phosphohydroxy)-L-threonine dehydrogenase) n=1 Tax=uncultured bacterium BAC13K9BAC TaxID=332979 RepID=Q4JN67_9BACT|nr:predicted 4-hydroxythreonine-4-phosphate dehydrogenase (4-(phosphohydroxy)-L-threonine dehydrogenase) [uncultured bacterium BAC13K9BAC]
MSIKIAITVGDPGGIGPDICVLMAEKYLKKYHIIITDPQLLIDSSKKLNKKVFINILKNINDAPKSGKRLINVLPIKLNKKNKPGHMNPINAPFVINAIETAAKGCLNHNFQSMVTGPISKSILNRGGFKISGHTELLAKICKSKSIMMLMNDKLKVTLQTIHVPLNKVSKQITEKNIIGKIKIINHDLINKFGLKNPKILICGLNPHAGEEGILGNEEINIIKPAILSLKKLGINVDGPVPADTAFISKYINEYDVIHTMYHDQGLPVIKYDNFSKTTNVTLGLPIIRVSVDHGTATELVGTGNVDISSFIQALKVARDISKSVS